MDEEIVHHIDAVSWAHITYPVPMVVTADVKLVTCKDCFYWLREGDVTTPMPS